VIASRLALLVCAVGLVAAAPAQRAAPARPSPVPEASADTLRYSIAAGQTLIVGLPPRVGSASATYEIVDAPALSWLVDRSFMWRTLSEERGAHLVHLGRRVDGAEPEEVVLLVEVTP